MVLFPHCKINLGLNIVRKRDDGYHDLETVFYPLTLLDALELIEDRNSDTKQSHSAQQIQFTASGMQIPADGGENICIKAYGLLKNDFPQLPPIRMHLHKAIPIGAGLGGGSSDGAYALTLINEKFHLGLSKAKLMQYALKLGSDCPFFILNAPCFAWGRGEKMEEIPLDLSPYSFLIVWPRIMISTAWAFSNIQPQAPKQSLKEILLLPVSQWKDCLMNDFEILMARQYPEIKMIKDTLYNSGAVFASLTGSGSALYGIFEKDQVPELFHQTNYFQKKIN